MSSFKAGLGVDSPSSRRVVKAGGSTPCPKATWWIALTTSWPLTLFRRYPLAPALQAASISSRRSEMVKIKICTLGRSLRRRRIISTPQTSGRCKSIKITSGETVAIWLNISAPVAASPTTFNSGSSSKIRRSPYRNTLWVSARRTLIMRTNLLFY